MQVEDAGKNMIVMTAAGHQDVDGVRAEQLRVLKDAWRLWTLSTLLRSAGSLIVFGKWERKIVMSSVRYNLLIL